MNLEKPVYPKLEYHQKRNAVLTKSQVEEMKFLRLAGKTIDELAEHYKISKSTVLYHTNEKWRRKKLDDNHRRQKIRYENDPEYKEHLRKLGNESQKIRRKTKSYSQWLLKSHNRYKVINRKKVRVWQRESQKRYNKKESAKLVARKYKKKILNQRHSDDKIRRQYNLNQKRLYRAKDFRGFKSFLKYCDNLIK